MITAVDVFPNAALLLVGSGLVLNDARLIHVEDKVAIGVDLDPIAAFEVKRDGVGIGSRANDEVVFELALIAVVHEINPRIYLFIPHARIRGDIRQRLPGAEVMNFPRLFFFTTNGGSRIRAHKRRRQRDALARMSQREAVPFC